jgi:hypothetical protein
MIEAGSEVEITQEQFCQLLKQRPPSGNCSATQTAPRVPGVNQSEADFSNNPANGCGSGTVGERVANLIGPFFLEHYSGDPNSPWAGSGVSFRSACISHDICYSSAEGKVGCDDDFAEDLAGICGENYQPGSTPMNICTGWAGQYSGLVRTQGDEAFGNAQEARQCALYHEDLKRFGCE